MKKFKLALVGATGVVGRTREFDTSHKELLHYQLG